MKYICKHIIQEEIEAESEEEARREFAENLSYGSFGEIRPDSKNIEVEVEPTKGEWEFFDYPYMGYRCSKCGAIGNYDHKFCHDCGIEMKVEPTEE